MSTEKRGLILFKSIVNGHFYIKTENLI